MTRLYGKNEEINKENVKEFFDKRANKEVDSLMTITSFQDKENLDQRQIEESKILLENIDLVVVSEDGQKYFMINVKVILVLIMLKIS